MKLNWGTGIFIFILIFLTIAIIFVVFAKSQDNDLVSENYYNDGAAYTKTLEIINRSAIYKDSIKVNQQSEYIVTYLAESLNNDVTKLNFWFYRPSSKEKDFKTELEVLGDSLTFNKSELARGRYILKISWMMQNKKYAIEKDMFIN